MMRRIEADAATHAVSSIKSPTSPQATSVCQEMRSNRDDRFPTINKWLLSYRSCSFKFDTELEAEKVQRAAETAVGNVQSQSVVQVDWKIVCGLSGEGRSR